MENIKLKYLNSEHTDGLCELYAEIFGKNVKPDYFIVKYSLKKNEVDQFSTVILLSGKIIGFFGVINQEFFLKDTKLNFGAAGDYFLIEKYRKQKVFEKAYQHSTKLLIERNYSYIYALQSEQTYKLGVKWGWQDHVFFSRFHLKTKNIKTSKILSLLKLSLIIDKKLEQNIQPYIIKNAPFLYPKNKIAHLYSEGYLLSKSHCKHYLIEIENCLMWIKFDRALIIGYLHLKPNANISKMLLSLKKIAKESLISEVIFHVHSNSSECILLKKQLIEKPSFKVSSLQLDEKAPSFDNVHLNFMDMDIF